MAGGVDEETFIRSFEDVPKVQIYSAKELEEHLLNTKTIIQDPNNDWARRTEAVNYNFLIFLSRFLNIIIKFCFFRFEMQLKRIRSLLIAGAFMHDELWQHVRLLEQAFQTSVKDLRYG